MFSAAPVSTRYQLLIVELLEEDEQLARILSADFETDDLRTAMSWAADFNGRELEHPINSWAIIRVLPAQHLRNKSA